MDFSPIIRKWAKANGIKQSTRKLSRELWDAYVRQWQKEFKGIKRAHKADKTEWREKFIAVYLVLTASMTYPEAIRFEQQEFLIRDMKKVIDEAKP